MKRLTREWIDKAEADYAIALLARRSRKRYSRDIVCFHLQQCVEKYLKGRLVEAEIAPPRTHNVLHLLDLILPIEPMWIALRPAMATITAYSVEYRYPGRTATTAQTRTLLNKTVYIRELIRSSMGLM
jgi:HEPN domain-containing protein